MQLYTVYDKLAQQYGDPYGAKNDDVAIRSFRAYLAAQADRNKAFRPDDFLLYSLGMWTYDWEVSQNNEFASPAVLGPLRLVAEGGADV